MMEIKLARNFLKKMEHQTIEGKTMYLTFISNTNEGVTWTNETGETSSDRPVTRSDMNSFIKTAKALISSKKAGIKSLDSKPIIINSEANHHMISARNLISDVKPSSGNVIIANNFSKV